MHRLPKDPEISFISKFSAVFKIQTPKLLWNSKNSFEIRPPLSLFLFHLLFFLLSSWRENGNENIQYSVDRERDRSNFPASQKRRQKWNHIGREGRAKIRICWEHASILCPEDKSSPKSIETGLRNFLSAAVLLIIVPCIGLFLARPFSSSP